MHVPVRVLFFVVPQLPHGADVFVWDLKVVVYYWLAEDLITPLGAALLQLAVNAEALHWDRVAGNSPTPVAIRLAS